MGVTSGNFYLNMPQMTENAKHIMSYLLDKGWTKNAICGMLGNMQTESTINPGIWQSLIAGNYSGGLGWCNGHRQQSGHHGHQQTDMRWMT